MSLIFSSASPFKAIASFTSRALNFFSDNPDGTSYPSPNPGTAEGGGSNN
jgi:hypothetical protein